MVRYHYGLSRDELLGLTLLEIDDMFTSLSYILQGKVPSPMVFAPRQVVEGLAQRTGIPVEAWMHGMRRKGR